MQESGQFHRAGELDIEQTGEGEDHDEGIDGNEFAELVLKATTVGSIGLGLLAWWSFVVHGEFAERSLLGLRKAVDGGGYIPL